MSGAPFLEVYYKFEECENVLLLIEIPAMITAGLRYSLKSVNLYHFFTTSSTTKNLIIGNF